MLCLTCTDLQQQEMGDRNTEWLTQGWVLQEEALKATKNGWKRFVITVMKTALEEGSEVGSLLLRFRGRCPFTQFIPSKPSMYGINIWAAVSFYTWCKYKKVKRISCGKKPDRYATSGHNLTFFFTWYNCGLGLVKRTDDGWNNLGKVLQLHVHFTVCMCV